MWVRFSGQEDSLEKEMATHSIFLPGQSQGQRSLCRKDCCITEHASTHVLHAACILNIRCLADSFSRNLESKWHLVQAELVSSGENS